MNKILRALMIILGVFILMLVSDIISIKLSNKPLIIFDRDKCECEDKTYYGLLYNTYYCANEDKAFIKGKNTKFNCSTTTSVLIARIKETKDNYIVISGIISDTYPIGDLEAHITLDNNPEIIGANNLIVGQYIKVNAESIKERYPSEITTSIIEVINIADNFRVIDNTKVCSEALEMFYQKGMFKYYFSCIQSSTTFVEFSNNREYTLKEAVNNNLLDIEDVINEIKDTNNIDIIVEPEFEINVTEKECTRELISTKEINGIKQNIYSYCLDKIDAKINDNNYELFVALEQNKINFEDIVYNLKYGIISNKVTNDVRYDGGSTIYYAPNYTIIKCNSLEGNRDYYIGKKDMPFLDEFCQETSN